MHVSCLTSLLHVWRRLLHVWRKLLHVHKILMFNMSCYMFDLKCCMFYMQISCCTFDLIYRMFYLTCCMCWIKPKIIIFPICFMFDVYIAYLSSVVASFTLIQIHKIKHICMSHTTHEKLNYILDNISCSILIHFNIY